MLTTPLKTFDRETRRAVALADCAQRRLGFRDYPARLFAERASVVARMIALFIALAVGGLSACVVIPIPVDHVRGRAVDPSIEVGVTTEGQLIAKAGKPDAVWESERIFVYRWEHADTVLAFESIGHSEVYLYHDQALLIQFDAARRVARAERVQVPSEISFGEFLNEWAKGKEAAAAKSADSTIVLLRLMVQDQKGDHFDPFALSSEFKLYIGDFDSGGIPKPHDFQFLSEALKSEGWLMLRLSPGYYYIHGGIFHSHSIFFARDEDAPRRWRTFRIEVPPGVPIVYAGTFHVVGNSRYVLTQGRQIVEIDSSATSVEDETDLAVQTAHNALPALPRPLTRLAEQNFGPILLGVPQD